MPSHWRGRALPLAVAVLAAAVAAPPTHAAPRATRGRLTGDTTIVWSGTAGIVLDTKGTGSLPQKQMTLTVKGGSFAFVSMFADPQPKACDTEAPGAHCHGFHLALFPYAGEFVFDTRPGHDHMTKSPPSSNIVNRRLNVYLMTDGTATLRLRPNGYSGRSSYVAGGRIRGKAAKLPGSCDIACGSTPVSEFHAGGAVFDYGRAPGHVITIAYTRADDMQGSGAANHPLSVRTCFYPNPFDPDASADPASYPHGCDGPTGADPLGATSGMVSSVTYGLGYYASWNSADRTGKQYVGFSAGAARLQEGVSAGYGVWFSYGIT